MAKKIKKSVLSKITGGAKKLLGGAGKKTKGITSAIGLGGSKARKRGSRRKSAMWYARELARLKLKKRYDKLRLRI